MKFTCESCNTTYDKPDYITSCYICYKEICTNCESDLDLCESCKNGEEKTIYPDNFHDYKDGVKISDEEIKSWLTRVKNTLVKDQECDYTFISSGNTIVFAGRDDNDYVFRVCKGYEEIYINEDKIKDAEF